MFRKVENFYSKTTFNITVLNNIFYLRIILLDQFFYRKLTLKDICSFPLVKIKVKIKIFLICFTQQRFLNQFPVQKHIYMLVNHTLIFVF